MKSVHFNTEIRSFVNPKSSINDMPSKKLNRVMTDLSAYCKLEHGRQKNIASRLGVTQQTLSNWMAGRKEPSLEKYLRILKVLGR
jgi:DNA-binding XRE family transcriptional regulator